MRYINKISVCIMRMSNTIQCSTGDVLCVAICISWSAVLRRLVQYYTAQYNILSYSAVKYNIVQYNTVWCSAYLDGVLGDEFIFPFGEHFCAHLIVEGGQNEVGWLLLKRQSLWLTGQVVTSHVQTCTLSLSCVVTGVCVRVCGG